MSDLLKEAIADAKAVRETALQNAKMALEEAFTPQLKSMLSAKLKEEEGVPFDEEEVGDGLDDEEVDTDISDSPEGTDGEADEEAPAPDEPSATEGESEESGVPGSQPDTEYEENETGDGLDDEEVPAEGEELNQEGMYSEEEEEVPAEEDEEVEEGALDLEAIIRELEDEVGAEEDEEMEEEEGAEEVPAEEEEVPAEEGSYEEDEEELEVDENLWKEEDEGDDDDDDDDDDEVEESKLHAELKEYKQAVKFLKNKLHEINILNAKLLFTNKLFKEFALNNNQKLKVVETFDRTQSTREIKLVYSTLAEQFGDNGSINKKSIKESASAKTGSTKPRKKVISEGAQVANRFKKLAGLL